MKHASAISYLALLLCAGCNEGVFVPENVDMNGCYGDKFSMIELNNGRVLVGGNQVSTFEQGTGMAGSFVIFKPALRAQKETGAIFAINSVPSSQIMTIMENGAPTILIPTEPLGQKSLTRRAC